MGRLLKCYGESCAEKNLKYPENELKKINGKGKNYCPHCYAMELKNREQREHFWKVVKQYYGEITGRMMKEASNMIKSGHYKYSGMALTIEYCVKVKRMRMDIKYGLGCVSTYYEDAKKHYLEVKKIKEKVKDKDLTPQQINVTINLSSITPTRVRKRITLEEYNNRIKE